MSKKKYKYNPHTLQYDEVELTWKDHLKKVSYHLISALVFSVILLALSYGWIKERGKKEALQTTNNDSGEVEYKLQQLNEELDEALLVLDELENKDDNIYRTIFGADPLPDYKRELGTGGNQQKYKELSQLSHSDLLIEVSEKLALVEKKIATQSQSFDDVVKLAKNKEKLLKAIPSIQPISNKDLTSLASGFGMRMHPIYKILKLHAGMDFTADTGTDIYATGDGVIEKAEVMSGYGNIVIIDHGFGYKTRYAHCSMFKCKPGQQVKRGDVIALVGNTGASVGPHVHYEVRYKGEAVNPVNYFFNDLSPAEYEEIVKIASRPTQSM